MSKTGYTEDDIKSALYSVTLGVTVREAARENGVPRGTLRRRLKKVPGDDAIIERIKEKSKGIDEILSDKRKTTKRVLEHQESVRRIQVSVPKRGKAYGLLVMGDPHLDADGCNFIALERDIETCESVPCIYGINIGDLTNNWVGRLVREYANQSTTRSDAVKLAKWFINRKLWLAHVCGNHDAWNFGKEMLGLQISSTNALFASDGDLRVCFTHGKSKMNAHFRHDFKGNSQYNTAFGPVKAAFFGNDDHLLVQGHRHVSGETTVWHERARSLSRCIAVGTYKEVDSYAIEGGFRQSNYAPSYLIIVQPEREGKNGFVRPFDDVQEGADYLEYLNR